MSRRAYIDVPAPVLRAVSEWLARAAMAPGRPWQRAAGVHAHALLAHAEDYRKDYNHVRPHEAIAWNRPYDVHTGVADPSVPNFPRPQNLPTT